MKQLFFFLSVVFISYISNAQLTKGNWLVGGNGSFSSGKNNLSDTKTTNLKLAPNIGYFLADKLVFGLKLDYTYLRDSYSGSGINSNQFAFGPFTRLYFLDKENLLNLFVEGNYSYGIYNSTGFYPINNGKLSNYSILLGPVFYFNKSVGLEFTVGYYNNNDITAKTINSGLKIGLGLQIHLEKDN